MKRKRRKEGRSKEGMEGEEINEGPSLNYYLSILFMAKPEGCQHYSLRTEIHRRSQREGRKPGIMDATGDKGGNFSKSFANGGIQVLQCILKVKNTDL